MRVAVEKIPGVDLAEVSLNEGFVDVRLQPDNELTVQRLRAVIREQGFSPRAAVVRVRGTLERRGGEFVLITPAWDAPLVLELGTRLQSTLPQAGELVVLDGHVAADEDDAGTGRLRVTAVQ